MELVVKDYPGVGNVSSHVCSRKVGDTLRVKGCFTKIKVEANKWKRVGMVAGGSGLTPCLQVAEELLSLPGDDPAWKSNSQAPDAMDAMLSGTQLTG